MEPEVRYLILCDDVQTDPHNLLRVNVFGLISHIRSTTTPSFPLVRPLLCVLVILTGCQGMDEMSYRIVRAGTGRVIFQSSVETLERRLAFCSASGIVPSQMKGYTG